MEYPAFRLDAVTYDKIATANKIFNGSEIEYWLHIHVPHTFARSYELYQIDEVADEIKPVCFKKLWEHDPGRAWYKFKSHMLNLTNGYHLYRLSFVNTHTDDTALLYMTYTIQTNQVDKPYIYMDREHRECNCSG